MRDTLRERMEDFEPVKPRCLDCRFRRDDLVFPDGSRMPMGSHMKCKKFDDKPSKYMFGDCPYYEKD